MILCECGKVFGNACGHAEHKLANKDKPVNAHRTCCSSGCGAVLGKLEPDFKGMVVSNARFGITHVFCEECTKLIGDNDGLGDYPIEILEV